MGIEAFPEIERFQKLPRQIIVKGGNPSVDEEGATRLQGIVINNIGHTARDVRVNIVILNSKGIPLLNTSTPSEPTLLPQGTIGSFVFKIPHGEGDIAHHHLYATWKFDDRE